jgi:hypothetical protein
VIAARLRAAVLLVVLILAGCSAPSTTTPRPTTPPPHPPTPPLHRNATVELVEVDGRWPMPENASRDLVRNAFGQEPGSLLVGEASFGRAAGPVAAFDERAAALLGGLRDALTNATIAPPPDGSILVTPRLLAAANLTVGANATLETYDWPPSRVGAAYEMERVRPCDRTAPDAICLGPAAPDGDAQLLLDVPPGSSDLQFHADVVELQSSDFPAYWNGTMISPTGNETPFSAAAFDRLDTTGPGRVAGPLEAGAWTIRFHIDAGGRRVPGAIAGFVTYTTLGFAPFDLALLGTPDAALQTRLLLQNATRASLTLRVAGVVSPHGAPALADAAAILSPDDARALLRLGAGNVTALAVPSVPGADDALLNALGATQDPALHALRPRAAIPASDAPPDEAASETLLWAPADLQGAALVVQGMQPLGAETKLRDLPLAEPPRVLSMPSSANVPWSLVPKAYWNDASAALKGIATGPHLVLLSDDLAREAGIDPANATYAKLGIDSALGPRTLFGMGTVAGGPTRAVWASAATVAANSAPGGARLVVASADENATLASVPRTAIWLGP